MQPGGGGSPLHLGCSPVYPGAVLAYSACLESHRGAACTFATGGLPAVVHRGALSGDEMRLIASQHAHVPESGCTPTFAGARVWPLRLLRTRLSALGDTLRAGTEGEAPGHWPSSAARDNPCRIHRLWPPRLRSHSSSVTRQGTISSARLAWVATRRDTW